MELRSDIRYHIQEYISCAYSACMGWRVANHYSHHAMVEKVPSENTKKESLTLFLTACVNPVICLGYWQEQYVGMICSNLH